MLWKIDAYLAAGAAGGIWDRWIDDHLQLEFVITIDPERAAELRLGAAGLRAQIWRHRSTETATNTQRSL
jgi:hypothetical protein